MADLGQQPPERDVDVVAQQFGESGAILAHETRNVRAWILSDAWLHRDDAA